AEAVQLLASNSGAKLLAGGHSVIPPMNLRLSQPELLIDIGRLTELKGITARGGSMWIGALSTHAEVESAPIHRLPPRAVIPFSSVSRPISISSSGCDRRRFIGGITLCPPASNFAPLLLARSCTASA